MDASISSGYITTNYTCFPCSAITHLLAHSFTRSLAHSCSFARSLICKLTQSHAHSFARSLICMITQLHPHPFARSLIHLLICLLTNSFAFLLAVSVAHSITCSLFARLLIACSPASKPVGQYFHVLIPSHSEMGGRKGGMAVPICPEPNDL